MVRLGGLENSWLLVSNIFVSFLTFLQRCGLRGIISLIYTDGSIYHIHFDEDEVYAEIRGEYEKHTITEAGI